MTAPRRTRPRSVQQRPDRTNVALPILNAPYPGCCRPTPDATFANQTLVKLVARHVGPNCKGYLEPMSVETWNADVHDRARRRDGGDAG